jgi:hypothetical protein
MFKLRKFEIVILIGIVLALSSFAYGFFAMEQITVSNSVKTLTSATYGTSNRAFLTLEDANIRFTYDGVTTPTTAGVGHLLVAGQGFSLEDAFQIKNFKAIRAATTDAKLTVTYQYVE